MGNNNSTHRYCETESTSTSKLSKIPKHLQPLKRKQTKKTSTSSASSSAEPKASVEITPPLNHPFFAAEEEEKKKDKIIYNNRALSNPTNTFQAENYRSKPLDCAFIEHSISSPQFGTKNKKNGPLKYNGVESIYLPIPCSQSELDRQRVQVYIMRWAFESRHLVPPMIKQKLFEGIRVLDVGCGPGLWVGHPVMDLAEDFCKSVFDSVDVGNLIPPKQEVEDNWYLTANNPKVIEPVIKSKSEKLTDNLTFTKHNVVRDGILPFEDDTFGYVQQTQALLVYNKEDWKKIVLDLKRVTKPGGYIRLLEVDLYPHQLGHIGSIWRDRIHQLIGEATDIPTRVPTQLEKVLAEAGLENIESKFVTIPVGAWGLDIGNLWEQNLYGFLESFRPYLSELMGITPEMYDLQRKQFVDELQGGNIKPFNNIYMAWGKLKETE